MKALVLAGGYPQIALIEELKSRGIVTILADYYEEPVAKKHADIFYRVSTLDIEGITEIAKTEKVDFIITACTDQALLTVAKVSEKLGLPCYIDYQTALNVTNKQYMKKVFEENDIPSARHVIMGSLDKARLQGMEYPLIVKPVDCNSSKGVKKVTSDEELEAAFCDAVKFSRTDTAIIEDYFDGEEITVDVQVVDGKAHILSMAYSDKIKDKDKFVIYRTRYPVSEKPQIIRQIADTTQKIADAFKLQNSPMLIQLISNGERISVLEFGARTGGGVKHRLIQQVSGVDVISAVVDLTTGKTSEVKTKAPMSKYITNLFIYCNPGVFDRLEGFEELKQEGIIEEYFLFKWKGAQMSGVRCSGDRIAGFTVMGNSIEEIKKKYDRAVKTVKVLDPDGNDIMRRDLIEPLTY